MKTRKRTKLVPRGKLIEEELSKAKSIEDLVGKEGIFARLFGETIQHLMEAELTNHLGYGKYEAKGRNSGNSRNGYSKRNLKTSYGTTPLAIPRDRSGTYVPELLTQRQRMSNEIEEKIIGLYAKGVSTRDIEETMADLYGIDVSSGLISLITDKVVPLLTEWKERPLHEVYAVVYLDAIHLHIRVDGKVKNRAVYCALGLTLEGKKDILGIWMSDGGEGANFWLSVITELEARGVKDILISCIDGLSGFKEAIQSVFPQTQVQRCIIHQIRNSLKYVCWKDKKEFIANLKCVYKATTKENGWIHLMKLKKKWKDKYALSIRSWENNWEDLSPFFAYPQAIRRIIYTTNSIESYNRVLRKATKNKGSFPSKDAALKVLYLATREVMKKWTMPIQNWSQIINQLAIRFEGRVHLDI